MSTLGAPDLVALIDNPVNYTLDPYISSHLSTLAPIVDLANEVYDAVLSFYAFKNTYNSIWRGSEISSRVYEKINTNNEFCPSFRDPREEVLNAFNRLMVYMSVYTNEIHSKAQFPGNHLATDLAVKSEITGFREGSQNVSHDRESTFTEVTLPC